VTWWKRRADDTSVSGKPGIDAVAHALWSGWHLPRRPLPNAAVNAAPEDALVSRRFSTDESVANRYRFQHRLARSSHGLRSPPRSLDTRCRLRCAARFPTACKHAAGRHRGPVTGANPSGVPRGHPSVGCSAVVSGLRRLPLLRAGSGSRRSAFSAVRGGPDARLDVPTAEAVTFIRASSVRVCPSVEVVKCDSQDALAPCASPRGDVGGGSPVGHPH